MTNQGNVGALALSPRPGALSCRRIEPQPTPVDLTPSDGEALMAHATEQIGLALAKVCPVRDRVLTRFG
jgi:hypothetical protein